MKALFRRPVLFTLLIGLVAFITAPGVSAFTPMPDWSGEADSTYGYYGYSVSTLGDVNGDGYDDIIVGAPWYSHGQTYEGAAYVYHGSTTGPSTTADWFVESDVANRTYGAPVHAAGDVNGDGYDDAIVGTQQGNIVFVYHGSAGGLSTTPDWTSTRPPEGTGSDVTYGRAVSTAGDVNGDGYDDVIIGQPAYTNDDGDYEGRAYVYYGSASGLSATPDWVYESNMGGSRFGCSVSTAGDVNGDGYDDVVVGAYEIDTAFAFYGSASGISMTPDVVLSLPSDTNFGYSVSTSGDVNGDGYDDVIVGAYRVTNGNNREGRALVYHGSATGLSTTASWWAESNRSSAFFGWSVSTAGDVNGDGYADVMVGAIGYANPESSEGRAYVYYGSASGVSGSPKVMESDAATAKLGWSVSTAGDVNGDGLDDVIAGAPEYDNGHTDEGGAFLYYLEVDTDGDGISDSVEGTGDPDGDGIPNYLDDDSDGDGVPDSVEGTGDADGDGIPNYLDPDDADGPLVDTDGDTITDQDEDTAGPDEDSDADGTPNREDDDSDNDGIPDSAEAGDADLTTPPLDSDGDGLPDFIDPDSDGDGIPDSVEGTGDVDGDGISDFRDWDDDGDGVYTEYEYPDQNGDGDPSDALDTDGDGAPDYLDNNDDDDLQLTADEDSDQNGDGNPVDARDTDGDGIPDYLDADDGYQLPDSDGDGVPDYLDDDDTDGPLGDLDGDTITNQDEDTAGSNEDADNDGIPNREDDDSDNDGIPDSVEAGDADLTTPPLDSDGLGFPDFIDPDSDNDGIPDATEGAADADGDGIPNYRDLDSDGDGVPDADEGTGDVDGDGVPNYLDDDDTDGPLGDLDGDTITNQDEDTAGPDEDSDGDGIPNREDDDSDNDGIPDSVEAGDADLATPPVDSDGDGLPDFIDLDSDGDGVPDAVEGVGDPDGDGVPNYLDTDSNGDGTPDGQQCTTPPNCEDTDGDGTPDYLEVGDKPGGAIYLPIILKINAGDGGDPEPGASGPDLVVEHLVVTADGVQFQVRNQGDEVVTDAFWIDLYIDPDPAPTGVNQTWSSLAAQGMAWGVTAPALPLYPDEVTTLSTGDPYYRPDFSQYSTPLMGGIDVYVQVDSANSNTDYGAVLEDHEKSGGPYNNILAEVDVAISGQTLDVPGASGPSQVTGDLPPRTE